ncbi:MAG TPA: MarR family transcriptional regulator [Ilumatobacteraceae bacterium]|nr:MarR family transcriptional regulator [Ilumatobacteraceae bacterium]
MSAVTADDPTLTIARLCRVLECNTTAGLTLPQYRVLGLLAGGDERASLLASRVSVAKPTLTSIVDSLFDRGLVSRETPDGDRRSVRVSITPAGRTELRKAAAEFRGVLDEVLMACDKPEAVLDALSTVRQALDDRWAQRVAAEQLLSVAGDRS